MEVVESEGEPGEEGDGGISNIKWRGSIYTQQTTQKTESIVQKGAG